jgi:hypothetical protein
MVSTFDEVFPGQTTLHEYLDNQPVEGPLNDTESYYTGQQRTWLALYLRQCADALGLAEWTLRLWHEPPDDDAHASVTATSGRKYASFKFDSFMFQQDADTARNHVAHELGHVLFEMPTQMVDHDLKGQLSDSALAIFQSGYRRQMEYATDHLAGLLARLLPLPPWASVDVAERTRKANLTAQEQHSPNGQVGQSEPATITAAATAAPAEQ